MVTNHLSGDQPEYNSILHYCSFVCVCLIFTGIDNNNLIQSLMLPIPTHCFTSENRTQSYLLFDKDYRWDSQKKHDFRKSKNIMVKRNTHLHLITY